jgi:hypothetical protein
MILKDANGLGQFFVVDRRRGRARRGVVGSDVNSPVARRRCRSIATSGPRAPGLSGFFPALGQPPSFF